MNDWVKVGTLVAVGDKPIRTRAITKVHKTGRFCVDGSTRQWSPNENVKRARSKSDSWLREYDKLVFADEDVIAQVRRNKLAYDNKVKIDNAIELLGSIRNGDDTRLVDVELTINHICGLIVNLHTMVYSAAKPHHEAPR